VRKKPLNLEEGYRFAASSISRTGVHRSLFKQPLAAHDLEAMAGLQVRIISRERPKKSKDGAEKEPDPVSCAKPNLRNLMNNQLLKGKVALVAGGAKNLGGLISRTLGTEGAEVAVHYNSAATKSAAEETVAAIKAAGSDAFALDGDFTKAAIKMAPKYPTLFSIEDSGLGVPRSIYLRAGLIMWRRLSPPLSGTLAALTLL
jgi:hypothetical protein